MRSISLIFIGIAAAALGVIVLAIGVALFMAGSAPHIFWTGISLSATGCVSIWMARLFPPITYPYNPAKARRLHARLLRG